MDNNNYSAIQNITTPVVVVPPIGTVTSLADLQVYAKGSVVTLPDFAEGQPFIARVKRPSMLVLAKQGKIPNSLLSSAGELFSGGQKAIDTDNSEMLSDMHDILKIVCTSALISPTMAEIESVELTLSDDQMMALFSYTQTGIKALTPLDKK